MKFTPQILILLVSTFSFSQNNISDILKKHNSKNIPYISVQELAMPKTKAILLDAREAKEYNTSHINNAIHIGYDYFDIELVSETVKDKDELIVVYCSIGIRSEDIAKKLKKTGYTNVYNLYGGIFEWKNKNFTIYNSEGSETENVHIFSKKWSQCLTNGVKIYE